MQHAVTASRCNRQIRERSRPSLECSGCRTSKPLVSSPRCQPAWATPTGWDASTTKFTRLFTVLTIPPVQPRLAPPSPKLPRPERCQMRCSGRGIGAIHQRFGSTPSERVERNAVGASPGPFWLRFARPALSTSGPKASDFWADPRPERTSRRPVHLPSAGVTNYAAAQRRTTPFPLFSKDCRLTTAYAARKGLPAPTRSRVQLVVPVCRG